MAAEFFNGIINLIHHGIAALHVLVAKGVAAGVVNSDIHRNVGVNLDIDGVHLFAING